VWIVPSELNKALEGLGSAVGSVASAIPAAAKGDFTAPEKINVQREIAQQNAADDAEADRKMQGAIQAARSLERPSSLRLPERPAVTAGGKGSVEHQADQSGGHADLPRDPALAAGLAGPEQP
jgi:hypothetical protein